MLLRGEKLHTARARRDRRDHGNHRSLAVTLAEPFDSVFLDFLFLFFILKCTLLRPLVVCLALCSALAACWCCVADTALAEKALKSLLFVNADGLSTTQ